MRKVMGDVSRPRKRRCTGPDPVVGCFVGGDAGKLEEGEVPEPCPDLSSEAACVEQCGARAAKRHRRVRQRLAQFCDGQARLLARVDALERAAGSVKPGRGAAAGDPGVPSSRARKQSARKNADAKRRRLKRARQLPEAVLPLPTATNAATGAELAAVANLAARAALDAVAARGGQMTNDHARCQVLLRQANSRIRSLKRQRRRATAFASAGASAPAVLTALQPARRSDGKRRTNCYGRHRQLPTTVRGVQRAVRAQRHSRRGRIDVNLTPPAGGAGAARRSRGDERARDTRGGTRATTRRQPALVGIPGGACGPERGRTLHACAAAAPPLAPDHRAPRGRAPVHAGEVWNDARLADGTAPSVRTRGAERR